MRRALLVFALCIAGRLGAQERAVYLLPEVRAQLRASWDSTHAEQPERAYCLRAELRPTRRGDTVAVVVQATRAIAEQDNPYMVAFDCGPRALALHVHTPSTCTTYGQYAVPGTCVLGGPDAYQCGPSPADQAVLDRGQSPFAVIQCSPQGFVTYYPKPPSEPQ